VSGERGGGLFGFIAAMAACAVSLGLVVITATLLGVDALMSRGLGNRNSALYLLFGGTFGGIVIAAVTAWWLLRPIQSTYRRGGLALVCGFATVLVMLITIPIHQLVGRSGLIALLITSALGSLLLAWRARRLGVSP
jgi:hypothetical protein